jgi:Protein of unknown function (DUF1566)/Divergent InlB B-repeat domain/Fibronectin type III domain
VRTLLLILFTLLSLPAFSSSYTKIANNGTALPASAVLGTGATNWACTRDNANGLIWEVKTADGGLRDQYKTYTNYDDPTKLQKRNGSAYVNPTQADIDAATNSIGFAKAINVGGLCGHNDWRMPSKDELASLWDLDVVPSIDPVFFPNTYSFDYWSGSPDLDLSINAFIVDFHYGSTPGVSTRYKAFPVRLVSSGQPSSSFSLLITPTGSGTGTVTSSPAGLDCIGNAGVTSGTCLTNFASGTSVTLTATPISTSTFTGWSNACSGSTTTCTLTMDAAKSVTANFNSQASATYALSLSATGSGSGTVTSSPAGINCIRTAGTTSGTCSTNLASSRGASFIYVMLTATPANGSTFTGWGGACSGTRTTCSLTMNAAKGVIASFNGAGLTSQTITFGPTPNVTVGATGIVSATASSGLPVTIISSTLNICTLSGNTVSGVTAGVCNLTANQSGNSSYSPAAAATLSFSIAALGASPGAPKISAITPGAGSATLIFSPPDNTGGSPIVSYTATCTASGQTTRTANGTVSPLTVKNLIGHVLYQCALTASNSAGLTGSASASTPVTPLSARKSSPTPILMLLFD